MDTESGAELVVHTPRRHLRLRMILMLRPASGRRRVWDRVASLENEIEMMNHRLDEARRENFALLGTLSETENEVRNLRRDLGDAEVHITELEDDLTRAVQANVENSHRLSFSFQSRDVEPMEQVTHPVPVVELLADTVATPVIDPDLISTSTEAATVLLDRITSPVPRPKTLTGKMSTTGTYRVVTGSESPFTTTDPAKLRSST